MKFRCNVLFALLALFATMALFSPSARGAPTSQPFSGNGMTFNGGLTISGQSDLIVSNVTVNGGTFCINGCNRIDVGNCTFAGNGYLTWGQNAGLTDSRIHDCYWIGRSNSTGIAGWGMLRGLIDHNTSSGYTEWCHLFGGQNLPPGKASCGAIVWNTITGGSRNDIEVQEEWQSSSGGKGLEVAYNSVTARQANLNGAGMAASIATGGTAAQDTHGVDVHDNILSLRGVAAASKKDTCPLEIMGNGNRVEHNFLDSGNFATTYTMTNMTRSVPVTPWTWKNNQLNDCNYGTIASEDDGLDGNKSLVPTIVGPTDLSGNFVTHGAAIPTVAQWIASIPAAPAAATGAIAGFVATPAQNAITLTWANPLPVAGSLHTYTPTNDLGTLTISAGSVGAVIGNLPSGWSIKNSLSAGSLAASSMVQTLGASPDGTTASIATLVALSPVEVLQPTTAPSVTHVITIKSDGSYETK